MTKLFLILIRGYQLSLARVLPAACRYYPSCSHYTYESIERYVWLNGGWMGAARIARCHPWSDCGEDLVPPRKLEIRNPKSETNPKFKIQRKSEATKSERRAFGVCAF